MLSKHLIPLFNSLKFNVLKIFIFIFLFSNLLYASDKFAVITGEKTGTHLLTRALTFLTDKKVLNCWERYADDFTLNSYLDRVENEDRFFHMHAFPETNLIEILKARGYKVIFLLRDPRDQLISVLFYILDRHWEYGPLRLDNSFGQLSFNEKIEDMITGEKSGLTVPGEFIGRRLPWMLLEDPPVYTAYFENLVGPDGDGDRDAQITELIRLAEFLNIEVSNSKIEAIADSLFGWEGLGTFRAGQIGSWKLYFTEQHKEIFKHYYGQFLIDLGYESDLNW